MRLLLAGFIAASLTSGCATTGLGGRTIALTTQYDAQEIAWAQAKGTAAVTGQAFFQTRGGQPRTCAGLQVVLVPDSAHTRERLQHVYGSVERGYRPVHAPSIVFVPNDPAYQQVARTALCDAQGNFEFSELPACTYYVVTNISWVLPGNYVASEGGWLMQRVQVAPGQRVRVILAS